MDLGFYSELATYCHKFKRYATIYTDLLIQSGATLLLKLILWLADSDY